MKTNDENELLRSTGKNGGKGNGFGSINSMIVNKVTSDLLAKVMLSLVAIGPFITWLLPEDSLVRWPVAAQYSEFIAGHIPVIDKLTSISSFPQVTRLFLALIWGIVAPLFFLVCVLAKQRAGHLRQMATPEWAIWTAPLIGLSFCWAIADMPFIETASRFDLKCEHTPFEQGLCLISDSRFWLGLFAPPYVATFSLFLAVIPRWPNAIRQYYENKPN